MKYKVGDELYLKTEHLEGPVRVTHCGSKFGALEEIYYCEQIDEPIERAATVDQLAPLTAVGAGAP